MASDKKMPGIAVILGGGPKGKQDSGDSGGADDGASVVSSAAKARAGQRVLDAIAGGDPAAVYDAVERAFRLCETGEDEGGESYGEEG